MASLILPRRFTQQPHGCPNLDFDCGVPWGEDTEVFLTGAISGGSAVAVTDVQPKMVGSAVFNHINQNGLNTSYSASTTGGQISGRVVTPPKNLSIFGLMVTRSDWVTYDAFSSVGGFNNSSIANASVGALYTGNAAMALMFGGREGVVPYAPSAVGVAFTYSDDTTELLRPATGGEATNRDTWFIGASFKDAYEYTLFAKNLTTGMLFSQVAATTKSLKQVAQPFQILSSLPYLTTTWARQQRQLSAYVGYTGSALDADAFARIASDPWQIFRAKPRVLYFDVAGGGGTTGTGSLTATAVTASGSGVISHTGTGSPSIAAVTASGTGTLAHTGAGSLTTAATTASGTGTVEAAGVVTGTGAITVGAATASGAGVLAHTGSGALSSNVVSITGAGSLAHTGTGAATTAAATVSGGGFLGTGVTGTGSITIGNVVVSGTGNRIGWDVAANASGIWTEQTPASGGWTEQAQAAGNWTNL